MCVVVAAFNVTSRLDSLDLLCKFNVIAESDFNKITGNVVRTIFLHRHCESRINFNTDCIRCEIHVIISPYFII